MTKQSNSRVSPEKRTKYTTEYLTNGNNKTQAYLKTIPTATYDNAQKNAARNHKRTADEGMIEAYEELHDRVKRKALVKVNKTLDREDKEGRDTAKAIVISDRRDNINISTNIITEEQLKLLHTLQTERVAYLQGTKPPREATCPKEGIVAQEGKDLPNTPKDTVEGL